MISEHLMPADGVRRQSMLLLLVSTAVHLMQLKAPLLMMMSTRR